MNSRRFTAPNLAVLLSRSYHKLTTPYEAKLIRVSDLQLILNSVIEDNHPPGPWIIASKERT